MPHSFGNQPLFKTQLLCWVFLSSLVGRLGFVLGVARTISSLWGHGYTTEGKAALGDNHAMAVQELFQMVLHKHLM